MINSTNGHNGQIARFQSEKSPCPICGGHEGLTRGRGIRCFGFLSSDGLYAHCTRSEYAHALKPEPNGTFAHRLNGPCRCGVDHGRAGSAPMPSNPQLRVSRKSAGRRSYATAYECLEAMGNHLGHQKETEYHLISVSYYPDALGNHWMAEGRFEWGAGFKTYRTCHFFESEWWTKDPEGKLPLYNLPQIVGSEVVLILEGPKCANLAGEIGFVATTSSHGAQSAAKTDWSPLAGKQVVIIPDHDAAGEKYETDVRAILAGLDPAPVVKVVKLPGLGEAEDIEQWRDRCPELWGPDEIRADLQRLIDEAPTSEEQWATAADVLRFARDQRWIWNGWIPERSIVAITGDAGTGKSRFFGDLHRRIHLGMEWPDSTPPNLDYIGSRSLWICADGNHNEIPFMLEAYGVPLDSVVFPAPPENPFLNTLLDAEESQAAIRRCIAAVKPAFVVVDSLTTATGDDLCAVKDLHKLKLLFHTWTQDFNCTVILICHLSKEGSIFGRHTGAFARSIIDLNCPDPVSNYQRLSMAVTKSFAAKPAPLGVTMADSGNTYDTNPPDRVVNGKTVEFKVKTPASLVDEGREMIVEALEDTDGQVANTLFNTWYESKPRGTNYKELHTAFWSAVTYLSKEGQITKEGGRGTGCQVTLHLGAGEHSEVRNHFDSPF